MKNIKYQFQYSKNKILSNIKYLYDINVNETLLIKNLVLSHFLLYTLITLDF